MNNNAREDNHHNINSLLECPKGDDPCGYLAEIIQLRHEVLRLTEQIRTDALTGLYNFRFFTEALAIEMERTRRAVQPMALIILDVDHFKPFNDRWGHEQGNRALIHIGHLINLAIRKLDMACRFGGEEFVIILPNTELRQAAQVAERLRETVASTPLLTEESDPAFLTISAGVDVYTPTDSNTAQSLVRRVDSWLYKAKHSGRNCIAHPDIGPTTSISSVTHEEKAALFGPPKA